MNATAAFVLRDHQIAAVDAVQHQFDVGDRALVTMPCGTGKTAVAAEVARRIGGSVVVFVPTLALVRQSIAAYRCQLGESLGAVVVVASESGIVEAGLAERAATCVPDLVAVALSGFVHRRGSGCVDLVVCTYHSAPVLAEAQRRSRRFDRFDLAVHDEAHRLAGSPDVRFSAAHRAVVADRHLFVTATAVTCGTGRPGWIPVRGTVSMDDETVFGPRVYELDLAEARRQGLLCDWRVLVCDGGGDDAGTVDAVLAAVREHALSKVLVFVSRVRTAHRLAAAFNAVGGLDDGRSVRAQVVHSQLAASRRAQIIDDLDADDRDTVEIVCNVDCLTEGVDVAGLDAVVFTSDKTSRVDVVQALGRVLRPAPGKRHGFVVVPVTAPVDGDVDGVLRSGRFACLWSTLRSLRDVDTVFAGQLDRRCALGLESWTARCDLDRLVVDLDPELAVRLRTFAVEACVDTWWTWYHRVTEHVAVTGWRDLQRDAPRLAAWCSAQRRARIAGLLQDDRVAALERVDGWWWIGGFTGVADFAARLADAAAGAGLGRVDSFHGPDATALDVPGWRRHVGVLAAWVRVTRRRGLLPAGLVERFDRLEGWSWSVLDVADAAMVDRLARFRGLEGHADVPADHVELGEPLGAAVQDWRLRHAAGNLDAALAHEVEAAGGPTWRWRRDAVTFAVFVDLVAAHVATHGDTYGIGDETVDSVIGPFPFGRWVARTRHQHRRGRLDPDRVAALEAFEGWSWSGMRPRTARDVGDRSHGTRSGYVAGCRCVPCTGANQRYNRELAERRATGEVVDRLCADDAGAALARLTGAGLSTRVVARLLGVSRSTLTELEQGRRRQVTVATNDRLCTADPAALFDQVIARAETDRFYATVRVPATATWARIDALIAAGWTKTAIAGAAGLGRTVQLRRDWVSALNAARIERVWRSACTTGGGDDVRVHGVSSEHTPCPPPSTHLEHSAPGRRRTVRAGSE